MLTVPAAQPIDPPIAELPLSFDGVAEQRTAAGAVVRVAIVTGPGDEVFVVSEGQTIADRYAVVAVTPDGLELKDLVTGATRRIHLQS
jgi:hypothetical protein